MGKIPNMLLLKNTLQKQCITKIVFLFPLETEVSHLNHSNGLGYWTVMLRVNKLCQDCCICEVDIVSKNRDFLAFILIHYFILLGTLQDFSPFLFASLPPLIVYPKFNQ